MRGAVKLTIPQDVGLNFYEVDCGLAYVETTQNEQANSVMCSDIFIVVSLMREIRGERNEVFYL